MSERLDALLQFLQRVIIKPLGRLGAVSAAAVRSLFAGGYRFPRRLFIAVLLGVFAYGLYVHPPFATCTAARYWCA